MKLKLADEKPNLDALCAGSVDIAAAIGVERDICDAAVGFRVAKSAGNPVVFFVNRDALMRFEVESLIQYAIDNGETVPSEAGLEPLTLDELQETQTKLEQVVAGVG